jgi:hypothetical protein
MGDDWNKECASEALARCFELKADHLRRRTGIVPQLGSTDEAAFRDAMRACGQDPDAEVARLRAVVGGAAFPPPDPALVLSFVGSLSLDAGAIDGDVITFLKRTGWTIAEFGDLVALRKILHDLGVKTLYGTPLYYDHETRR